MTPSVRKYALPAIKILLALAFLAAGFAKVTGAAMMVATFDAIGLGQWFRYLTGAVEIGAAALLFIPGVQAIGAALLVVTMTGAVAAHLAILGPSALPAMVLGLLSAVVVYSHRDQFVRS